ncbi:unnamed protein product [Danaus chrysippus]|uniref:(African queen) hypothetical protein n=1 Tax=Danaus chrysippus TaxID=151541 RepID=A0A8J2VV06_9NEOP|nr:unnamed protein product [Danaus chrysippus]
MDVIVVGCGASGIAALRKLHDNGLRAIGLEAADRIGGRILSIPFGNKYLDLGAAWCHGEKDNKVFEMANKLDLLGRSQPDNKWFLLSNGDPVPDENSVGILQALNDELSKANKSNTLSISECIRKAAKTNSVLKKDPSLTQSFVEWFERDKQVGGQVDPKKGKSLKGLDEMRVCEGDFMLHWKGRGFKTILDILLNKYPDASKELPIQIHLNKEVEIIKWKTNKPEIDSGKPLVQIKCKDGSLYAAKSVIVTLSVGVLKERHDILFNPPLPKEKINAINNLQLCVLDKIYIEFENAWWPKSPASFTILWTDKDKSKFSSNEKWVTEIFSFISIDNYPNMLLAWIYGEGAMQMEKVSEEDFKNGVKKLLKVLFGKQFKMSPVKSIMRSQWASNPLVRGSYSYRSVASEENGGNAIILSEPLYHGDNFPVVCFAGEATSHYQHASAHGAIEAGFREAMRLVDKIKK